MKLPVVLCCVVLTACGSKQQAAHEHVADPEGPTAFTLALPAGMSGTMALYGLEEKQGASNELRATYPITTSEAEGGVVVDYGEARDIETPTLTPEVRALLVPMIQSVPSVLVRDGTVVRIDGYVEMRNRLDELLAPAYEQHPALKVQMETMLTEEFFLASAQEDWEWRGGAWHGRTMRVGETVEEESEVPMMFLQKQLPAKYAMTFVEALPCPGAEDRGCVRLKRELVLDPVKTKEALGPMGDALEIDQTIAAELVAEPATLLPYRFEKVESTEVRFKRGEQPGQSKRKQVVESYTWSM